MDRWQEIVNRSVEEEYKDMFGFQAGADWADEHPSEETIQKCFDLTRQMVAEMHKRGEGNPIDKQRIEYIQKHWNDGETK